MDYKIIPASEIQVHDLVVNLGVVEEIEDYSKVVRLKLKGSTKLSSHYYPWEAIGKDQRVTIIR